MIHEPLEHKSRMDKFAELISADACKHICAVDLNRHGPTEAKIFADRVAESVHSRMQDMLTQDDITFIAAEAMTKELMRDLKKVMLARCLTKD